MPIDEREKERRRNLVRAHYKVENNHDLEGIMKTFSPDAVMLYNRRDFPSDATIRWAHGYIGFTGADGAFRGLTNVIDHEHFTDTEIVIEGRACGTHTSEFLGFAPTGREVELPFVAFYRFAEKGKQASERVVMNLGPLHG
jgi:hypothetical protein